MKLRRTRMAIRSAFALLAGAGITMAMAAAAPASPFDPSGLIKVVKHPHFGANKSTNWFGYNQGSLEKNGTLFHSISGTWSVPVAKQHSKGQAGDSATWIGIGGGCLDASCQFTDPTGLIQTGTEQDVSKSGRPSYSAWWELVPAPAVTITNMKVKPRDRIHASVSEVTSGLYLWRIVLKDVTRNETFSTTALYPSSQASAEWIEETPTTIDTGGIGQASLPKLTRAPFTSAMVNGHGAALNRSERIQLVSGSQVIGTPSAPGAGGRRFVACAWATRCSLRRR